VRLDCSYPTLRMREICRCRLTAFGARARLFEATDSYFRTEDHGRLNLMKQTVRIAGGINELFGTLDETSNILNRRFRSRRT